jgi:hypothetical protein
MALAANAEIRSLLDQREEFGPYELGKRRVHPATAAARVNDLETDAHGI